MNWVGSIREMNLPCELSNLHLLEVSSFKPNQLEIMITKWHFHAQRVGGVIFIKQQNLRIKFIVRLQLSTNFIARLNQMKGMITMMDSFFFDDTSLFIITILISVLPYQPFGKRSHKQSKLANPKKSHQKQLQCKK